jgi:hypothetical protein
MDIRASVVRASLALVAFVSIATPSGAGLVFPPLGQLSLFALETPFGWILEANADGSDQLTSVSLTPPGKAPLAFVCEATGLIAASCEYDDDTPVASLAALLVDFPAGTWVLTVNGSLSADLLFQPVEPDGTVSVTSPADGAVGVANTPSVSYTNDCTNCNFLIFEIEPMAGGTVIEFLAEAPLASSGTLLYDDFVSLDAPKPETLADGVYLLFAGAINGALSIETLAPGSPGEQTFEFARGAERDEQNVFTVPEPAGAVIAAVAILAALARRRRQLP